MLKNRGRLAVAVTIPVLLLSTILILSLYSLASPTRAPSNENAIELPRSVPTRAMELGGTPDPALLTETLRAREPATSGSGSLAVGPGAGLAGRNSGSGGGSGDLSRSASGSPDAPDRRSEGATTFLVAGTHEENTDTLILVRLDSERDLLSMLSIPRDLYVEGQKINTIYSQEGISALEATVERITSTTVDHYVETDMYAFIDAIDLLGGIDVTLDQPLQDPSYVINENGRRSTLRLEAGTHHLNGRAALRYVRSRNTTSDFDRARRQQEVLHAVRDRVRELGFRRVDTLVRIAVTAVRYLRTDMSLPEMIRYAGALREVETIRGAVVSTDNVLEATYTALYGTGYSRADLTEEQLGAWILVPKDGDWRSVERFARDFLVHAP